MRKHTDSRIETPRLVLRDWKEDDILPFAAMNSNPTVMKYFLKSLNEKESLDFYNRIQDEFFGYGCGLYAVEKKETGEFIGYAGFQNITVDVDFTSGIEIGWRLKHEEWNHGLATEAAKACLSYAKGHLSFQTIWSFTSVINKSSEKVMQKIGMEKIREFPHPAIPENHPLKQHVLYKMNL
ncbi:MAG: GNAT family N-acetyltransferase [Bacteroidales bacterium]|nr:GNAT family N-acetyltransferase [Bacteroidales bacterium]